MKTACLALAATAVSAQVAVTTGTVGTARGAAVRGPNGGVVAAAAIPRPVANPYFSVPRATPYGVPRAVASPYAIGPVVAPYGRQAVVAPVVAPVAAPVPVVDMEVLEDLSERVKEARADWKVQQALGREYIEAAELLKLYEKEKEFEFLNTETSIDEDDEDFNDEMINLIDLKAASQYADAATKAFQKNPSRITSLEAEAALNWQQMYARAAFDNDWDNDDESFGIAGMHNTVAIGAEAQIGRDERKAAEEDMIMGEINANAYYKALDSYFNSQEDLWYQTFALQGKDAATSFMDKSAAIDGYNRDYQSYLADFAEDPVTANEDWHAEEMYYAADFMSDVVDVSGDEARIPAYLEYQAAKYEKGLYERRAAAIIPDFMAKYADISADLRKAGISLD